MNQSHLHPEAGPLPRRPDHHDPFRWIAWAEALFGRAGVPNPRIDAETLAAAALGLDRAGLYLHPRNLEPEESRVLLDWAERRSRREPLQHLLGEAHFFGRAFRVNGNVLIPRPETELLVEACLTRRADADRILDVGTGSGCIAVTLACESSRARIIALDLHESALGVARENAKRHGVENRITFIRGDLIRALRDAVQADLIVANLPYIATGEFQALQNEVSDFEPRSALDGGHDGLALIRRLIHDAPKILQPGGLLALEIAHNQGEAVRALLEASNRFDPVEIERDLSGYCRMAFATRAIH